MPQLSPFWWSYHRLNDQRTLVSLCSCARSSHAPGSKRQLSSVTGLSSVWLKYGLFHSCSLWKPRPNSIPVQEIPHQTFSYKFWTKSHTLHTMASLSWHLKLTQPFSNLLQHKNNHQVPYNVMWKLPWRNVWIDH